METYVSFLRGVNVSGKNPMKMEKLRSMFEEMGFKQVTTFIQSGNVVFQSKKTKVEKLEAAITDAILYHFGYDVPVIVLSADELESVITENPFTTNERSELNKLYVTFLAQLPSADLQSKLAAVHFPPDEFVVDKKVVYLNCVGGYGATKLSNKYFETKLKLFATTRNWKTTCELLEIARTIGKRKRN